MSAVKQAQEIPQRQLRRKLLARSYEKPRHTTDQPTRRAAVVPAWQSKKISALLPARSFQQTERNATPKTPAAKIFLRQSLRYYVMVNLQIRQIHAFRAASQQ